MLSAEGVTDSDNVSSMITGTSPSQNLDDSCLLKQEHDAAEKSFNKGKRFNTFSSFLSYCYHYYIICIVLFKLNI